MDLAMKAQQVALLEEISHALDFIITVIENK
jgi:hypothetical protein